MSRRLRNALGWFVLLVILCFVPFFVKQNYVLHVLIIIGVGVVLASSLRFVFLAGQLSLGHGAMVSLGAYFSSLTVMNLGFSFWLALPLAGIFAMIVSFLTGYIFTRLKGFYFAMITLFLTMVVQLVAEEWRGLTGGVGGLTNIPPPSAIGALGFDSKVDFYYLMLAIAIISLVILYLLEFSRVGLTLFSVRDSEALAASVGVNTHFYKVLAFGVGGFFAGVIGSFYCHYYSAVSPSSFTFMLSIDVLVFMVVGGRHHFVGPILGAAFLTVIPELGRGMKEYEPFIFAVVLLLIIIFLPRGLVGIPGQLKALSKSGSSPVQHLKRAIARGQRRA